MSLKRFLQAQTSVYATALQEVKNGQKQSHWIWYICPQMKGLGYSSTNAYYGIESKEEAVEYINHPVLSARLQEITNAMLQHSNTKTAADIFGTDAIKVKSSMTLFNTVCPNDIFARVLEVFYQGKHCQRTLSLLQESTC
ncbi:MAG: DUF1810 domain-containing protein [Paludibacter sp.]|nr:DUF1810 domain-containing protein [Bacteroidales bacterium]MCM1069748.1 DUF1810 domain-containing protein [Prevotella sp.]MCM1354433.1 DUF1810 domain-containing protein [Bacteroides sp.]MCM1443229.1 DUF1810 domain-containing protein [Muribaculum sp.]MCM1482467.1 DUF1810 domain-containing protein [Paludibacter sp.]